MSGRRILTDAQIDEMAELRERGWTLARIARHFADRGAPISAHCVRWQCLRVGAQAPRRAWKGPPTIRGPREGPRRIGRPFSHADDARLIALEGSGLGFSAIGRELGRSHSSVIGRLRRLAAYDARAEAEATR